MNRPRIVHSVAFLLIATGVAFGQEPDPPADDCARTWGADGTEECPDGMPGIPGYGGATHATGGPGGDGYTY